MGIQLIGTPIRRTITTNQQTTISKQTLPTIELTSSPKKFKSLSPFGCFSQKSTKLVHLASFFVLQNFKRTRVKKPAPLNLYNHQMPAIITSYHQASYTLIPSP